MRHNLRFKVLIIASFIVAMVSSCSTVSKTTTESTSAPKEIPPGAVSYTKDIEPLLLAKCSVCHKSEISYTWAKTVESSDNFLNGHNGKEWSTSEEATISKWFKSGALP